MSVKNIPLDSQTVDKVQHFESSMKHWAMEQTRLSSAAMDAMVNFKNLDMAYRRSLEAIAKEAGFDPSRVVSMTINRTQDGTCFAEISVSDEPAAEEAESAEPAAPPAS